jgi:hypothetical protein
MRRTRQGSTTGIAEGRAGDGAELPLLHPRRLSQLSNGEDGRRTCTPEGDCLILSEAGLSSFDAGNVSEVRDALSAGRPTPPGHQGMGSLGVDFGGSACY